MGFWTTRRYVQFGSIWHLKFQPQIWMFLPSLDAKNFLGDIPTIWIYGAQHPHQHHQYIHATPPYSHKVAGCLPIAIPFTCETQNPTVQTWFPEIPVQRFACTQGFIHYTYHTLPAEVSAPSIVFFGMQYATTIPHSISVYQKYPCFLVCFLMFLVSIMPPLYPLVSVLYPMLVVLCCILLPFGSIPASRALDISASTTSFFLGWSM